jgi:hypothetical protein
LQVGLEPLQSLHGRVVDADGTPVAGAVVEVIGNVSSSATSNGAGEFTATRLEPGVHRVIVAEEISGAEASVAVMVPGPALTVTLPLAFTIAGRVIDDSSGEAIAEAWIEASVVGRELGSATAKTDTDGSFMLKGLAEGHYEIEVSANGYLPNDRLEIALGRAETPADDITISLDAGLQVSGTIRDEHGNTLEGVRVLADRSGPAPEGGRGTSDERGEFILSGFRSGEISISFSKEGLVSEYRELTVDQDVHDLDIVLEQGYEVRGRVVSLGGEPIEQAMVSASRAETDGYEQLTHSDSDGSFHYDGMAGGSWKISAEHMLFERAEVEVDPSRQQAVTLALSRHPTGTITGVVSGADKIEWVRIRAQSADSTIGSKDALAEVDGSYRIDDFPAGPITVSAFSHARERTLQQTKIADLAPGDEVRIDFELDPGSEVRGRITRGGRPELGATLGFDSFAGWCHAETDANGDYAIELADGSYSLTIELASGEHHSRRLEVNGATVFDVELEGITVTGQVIDRETGSAVSGAGVVIELSTGHATVPQGDLSTGSTGTFIFEDLLPAPHTLKVSHPDYVQWRQELELGDGEPREVQVVLEQTEGVLVSLVDARTGDKLSGTVVAHDSDGRLVFDGQARREGWAVRLPLPPASYRISASASGYATHSVTTSAPADDVVIGLTPGGTLVVRSREPRSRMARLIMPSGEEYIRCWCNRIEVLELEGAKTTFNHIVAGSYSFVVHEPDQTTSSYPVTIIEGQRAELTIQ